jgi:hypothetical protein
VQFKKFRAPCEDGGFFRDRGFGFIPPFDAVSDSRLFDADNLRVRNGPDVYEYRNTLRAKRRSANRWNGTFRVKILVTTNGELRTTCKERITFRVTLSR